MSVETWKHTGCRSFSVLHLLCNYWSEVLVAQSVPYYPEYQQIVLPSSGVSPTWHHHGQQQKCLSYYNITNTIITNHKKATFSCRLLTLQLQKMKQERNTRSVSLTYSRFLLAFFKFFPGEFPIFRLSFLPCWFLLFPRALLPLPNPFPWEFNWNLAPRALTLPTLMLWLSYNDEPDDSLDRDDELSLQEEIQ